MTAERCFHCAEAIPGGIDFSLIFEQQQRSFCCAGCHAVAQTIIDGGLADYYRFRSQPADRAQALPDSIADQLKSYDNADVLNDIAIKQGELTQIELSVSGISCAACAWLIEKQLGQLNGVAKVSVNSATQRCLLQWRADLMPLSDILQRLQRIGYQASPFVADNEEQRFKTELNRQLNMDVPVTLAIYYTFAASAYATIFNIGEVYFESVCMFTFLLQLGKFYEYRARARARDATSNLLKIMPVSATLLQSDNQQVVSARRLQSGDVILVKAGEVIAADGVVVSGQSSVDESMLTGEYRAIDKQQGDEVMAGTVNHDGVLTIKVNRALETSRLGQIILLQQQTLSQKPAVLQRTDRLARYFVERLLVIAVATFALWYFWLDADRAFWVTLSVLVATCPCALSLAAPTAVTCALAQLNKAGVLIKQSSVLDVLPELSCVVFDKTGTLTEGRFSVQQVHCFSKAADNAELLNLIAAVEQYSEHPIARAFAVYLTKPLALKDVKVVAGAGISATLDGKMVKVGSASF